MIRKVRKRKLIEFIKAHPLLSINRMEAALEIPQRTIAYAIKGQRPIPDKYILRLEHCLKEYGYRKEKEPTPAAPADGR